MGKYSDAGFEAESLPEWEVKHWNELTSIYGRLDRQPESVESQIVSLHAAASTLMDEQRAHQINGLSPDSAVKGQMDDLGLLFDLERRKATFSTVTVTLTGIPGTVVTRGARALTADGNEFAMAQDKVLVGGRADAVMLALKPGPVPAPAGTLNIIATGIPGWESVTNALDALPGRLPESDPEYRASQARKVARGATASLEGLEAAIYAAGATEVKLVHNPSANEETEQFWPIAPHSTLPIVLGGDDEAITEAILRRRGMGAPILVAIQGAGGLTRNAVRNSNGNVTWNGTARGGLFTRGIGNLDEAAVNLNRLFARDPVAVKIHYQEVPSCFVAIFAWKPDRYPQFGLRQGRDTALGLDQTVAIAPPGPFIRPRDVDLNIAVTATQAAGFPADGYQRILDALTNRVDAYGIGEPIRNNDLLVAMELIPGCQVARLAVTGNSETPLSTRWRLPVENIDITLNTP